MLSIDPDVAQIYLIAIAVIEGKHFIWPNISSFVQIKIGKDVKHSQVKHNTDCPYYKEYFVFEYNVTLRELLEKQITITVIRCGGFFRMRKVLGLTTLDVSTIWYERDHQCYHKWAILSAPVKDPVKGTRGYLKVDINILTKGETAKVPPVTEYDDIEGFGFILPNLLIPDGIHKDRQKVNFIFTIYRGEDLLKKYPNPPLTNPPPTTSIEVKFASVSVKTSSKKSHEPVWNEQLFVPELFPPLVHRFQVILHTDANWKPAPKSLGLQTVSNSHEDGFFPTFGPAFMHFYSKNHLEGYMGKIMIALSTQVMSTSVKVNPKMELLPLSEELPASIASDLIVLHATVFDVSLIQRQYCDRPVSFRIGWGALKMPKTTLIRTEHLPQKINQQYGFLGFGNRKPCFYVTMELPDLKKRIFLFNLLVQSADKLRKQLIKVETTSELKSVKDAKWQTDAMIVEALDDLLVSVAKYLDVASTFDFRQFTTLEQERWRYSVLEMTRLHKRLDSCYCVFSKKVIFNKLDKMCRTLEMLSDELEDWPDIYIWMCYDKKPIAYQIISPKSIIYSLIPEEQGLNCGKRQTIYFIEPSMEHSPKKKFFACCKMDIIMWLGSDRHFSNFLTRLPDGFSSEPPDSTPNYLVAREAVNFIGLNYIFQGRIGSVAVSHITGFRVSLIVSCFAGITEEVRNTSNPIWNQSLWFPVKLYGSRKFLEECPPPVIVEVYASGKLIGRMCVKPIVVYKKEALDDTRLTWYLVDTYDTTHLELLALFILTEEPPILDSSLQDGLVMRIPKYVRPNMVNNRMEVLFWGVRNLKRVCALVVDRPRIVLECLYANFDCPPINVKKSLNFTDPAQIFETDIADEIEFARCITINMYDKRAFGMRVFVGAFIVPLSEFFYQPLTKKQRLKRMQIVEQNDLDLMVAGLKCREELQRKKDRKRILTLERVLTYICCASCRIHKFLQKKKEKKLNELNKMYYSSEDDVADWWTKFFASLQKIYENELELQPQFHHFSDILRTFPMYLERRTGDEQIDALNTKAVFKGAIKIYRWPLNEDYVTTSGLPIEKGVFQDAPSNSPLRYCLRAYIIRGINLRPKDANGRSDPYLYLTLNKKIINDKEHIYHRQINPTFGRVFEFNGTFPDDHTLTIDVYDWDLVTKDDLIGGTKIDVENRYYTRHRAKCGLPEFYQTSGNSKWRENKRPDQILEDMCRRWNLGEAVYRPTSVKVFGKEFYTPERNLLGDADSQRQVLALTVLNRWREIPTVGCELVPEHVETRSLYHPDKPGIEQGKLQMWIDIFPVGDLPPPEAVNIDLRVPKSYELRVIIWNCERIKLDEDDLFTNEKKSDIYVKGWMVSPDDSQVTDIHYRSLSGEANFNWRFIFQFDYLAYENKLVYKVDKLFEIGEDETRVPCLLQIQVWDFDAFQIDDFLASLTLNLSKLPRGAPKSKLCTIKIIEPYWPFVNLFKIRRMRGWWPVRKYDPEKQKKEFGGCIEIEFELLPLEVAVTKKVGKGRNGPDALPLPNRPEWSFSVFQNPFRTLKYIAKLHKWKMIRFLLCVILILMALITLYSVPPEIVKKLLHS